jgi:hypothetical protein
MAYGEALLPPLQDQERDPAQVPPPLPLPSLALRWVYLLKLWEKAELSLKAAVKSDGSLHKTTRNFLRSIQLSSAPSSLSGGGGGPHHSSVSQTHVPTAPSIPSLLGRSSGHQVAHHPLPPPPAIRYPSLHELPSRLPPSASQQDLPLPPVPILIPARALPHPSSGPSQGSDEIDEGELIDSDSEEGEASGGEQPPTSPERGGGSGGRKRGLEEPSAPPPKRSLPMVDYSVGQGQWEQQAGADAVAQSLFASVMQQAKGGG